MMEFCSENCVILMKGSIETSLSFVVRGRSLLILKPAPKGFSPPTPFYTSPDQKATDLISLHVS